MESGGKKKSYIGPLAELEQRMVEIPLGEQDPGGRMDKKQQELDKGMGQ